MDKRYDHKQFEKGVYEKWEKSGAFAPPPTDEARSKGLKPYCIIMPPPNANDPLHVGHAMFVTIEDILIRYHRMRGEAALWLPGTDHAGIETQYVFEKKLKKEGKSRFQFDRETLYGMIWDYVQENSSVAIEQMKQLGASADWERQKFTLDEDVVDFVLSTFERMHEEGLVYRDLRLVNYCTRCGTSYSDLEVKYEERNDPLYYMKYGPFELATVRPETKFGDTAVAVHPNDERYKEWIDKEVEVKGLIGTFKMRVVADEAVDPEFGTGVIKVTPAHDPNDFEVGQRHGLEIRQVIGFDGKLNEKTGPYAGLKVDAAREKVAEDLHKEGLISKVDEKYVHNVGVCYRCSTVIEPLPMAQFFVKVKSLTEKALKALDEGETKIYGAGHDKILRHWLTNLKDWNISRQIVWGIRMPIWYKVANSEQGFENSEDANHEIVVRFLDNEGKFVSGKIGELLGEYSFEEIEKGLQTLDAPKEAEYVMSREKPGGNFLQETDTFDTWFSSSQWPVVTLKKTGEGDFEYYYPTAVLETAYDILMFWVMRMMMMGIYLTDKSPFEKVYLHGLVRDEKGQKMSKSKGNVINPLNLVDKYGADALRMALVISTTAGHDSAVGESKVKGMRNFSNKIWNAARFIKLQREEPQETNERGSINDNEHEKRLAEVVKEVTSELERLKIGQAAETIHNEFWHWFCDECIEESKSGTLSPTLIEDGMKTFMKLLHPFMPFVTEVVWKELGYESSDGLLIESQWSQKK